MRKPERKTLDIPDQEWEETKKTANAEGKSMREAVRELLAEYRVRKGAKAGVVSLELRAVNKLDPTMVVTTSRMNLQELRAQLAPGKWVIEERTTTPYRPPARRERTTGTVS